MNIVVCVKQIIDPEIPTEQFKLDPVSKRQVRGGLSLVISAYDQNALEVALQLREKAGGKITALSLGEPEAQGAVKSAMGMGAGRRGAGERSGLRGVGLLRRGAHPGQGDSEDRACPT